MCIRRLLVRKRFLKQELIYCTGIKMINVTIKYLTINMENLPKPKNIYGWV